MSLLQELQKDAVDLNVDPSTLLRKCKILAVRLKNEEFTKWVENELNGYKSKDELPEYRILDTQSFGNFSGSFGSVLNNAPIPAFCLPKELQFINNMVYLIDGISMYSNLVKEGAGKVLTFAWPAEVIALYGQKIYRNMNCISAWRVIGANQIQNFLDTVRNRVLSFVLEIEVEDRSAGEAQSDELLIPTERVTQIYQTYILGNVSNISTGGTNVTQISYNEVQQSNFESLATYLKTIQVNNSDIDELESAINQDKVDQPKDKTSFGKKVSAWLGQMVSKAASGIWKISTSVAAEILSKAISNFYGLK